MPSLASDTFNPNEEDGFREELNPSYGLCFSPRQTPQFGDAGRDQFGQRP
jgi:hypothetical protein